MIPCAPVGMALPGLYGARRIALTDDGGGVATALAAELGRRGLPAEVLTEVPPDADAVVLLDGLAPLSGPDDAAAAARAAFRGARRVARRFEEQGGAFVTVQDSGGDFGIGGQDASRAWIAGLAALGRTAAREWPKAAVKVIDCARGGRSAAEIAAAIADELLQGGATLEVGLREDGARSAVESVAAPLAPAPPRPVRDGGEGAAAPEVVVASGGARGVTAACLLGLARQRRPRIALLGRTALEDEPAALAAARSDAELKRALAAQAQAAGRRPALAELGALAARIQASREIRATLAALTAAGAEARYLATDVQDAAAVAAALDEVRAAWGPVTLLLHAAGVVADRRISEKTDEQFARVYETKVAGLRALLQATAADPLRAIVLFSSVAARTGNAGQADYAMANEVLNAVACAEQRRRGGACLVRSLGWGPWDGGMVSPSLKAHFERRGVPLIGLDEGAGLFLAELAGGGPDVQVVLGGAGGAGALGAEEAPALQLEVRVGADAPPCLADHRLGGVTVVPAALIVEWLLRAARAWRGGWPRAAIAQLKVLRGIRLPAAEGAVLSVRCRPLALSANAATLAAEVCGPGGAVHYRATLELTRAPSSPPAAPAPPPLEPWTRPALYDGHVLFHGPRFQALRRVAGASRAGLVAEIEGAAALGWEPGPWRSDPAAIDGAIQAAVLWTEQVLGGASLPMGIQSLHLYEAGLLAGPGRCVVTGRGVHDAHASADVVLLDATGAAVAELRGLELVLRPDAGAAAEQR